MNTQSSYFQGSNRNSHHSEQFSFLLRSMEREKHDKECQKMKQSKQNFINQSNWQNNKEKNKNSINSSSILSSTINHIPRKQSNVPKFLIKNPSMFDSRQSRQEERVQSIEEESQISGVRMIESQELFSGKNQKNRGKNNYESKKDHVNDLIKGVKKLLQTNDVEKTLKNNRREGERFSEKSQTLAADLFHLISEIESNKNKQQEANPQQMKYTKVNNSSIGMKLGANKQLSSSYHFPSTTIQSFSTQNSNTKDANFIKKIQNLELEKEYLQNLISQHEAANIKMYIRLNEGESELIEDYKKILKDLFEKYRKLQALLKKNQTKQKQNLKKRAQLERRLELMQMQLQQKQNEKVGSSIIAISEANKKIRKHQQTITSLNIFIQEQNQSLEIALMEIEKFKERENLFSEREKNMMILTQELTTEKRKLCQLLESSRESKRDQRFELCSNGNKFMLCPHCDTKFDSSAKIPLCHKKSNSFNSQLGEYWKKQSCNSFVSSECQSEREDSLNIEFQQRKTMPRKGGVKEKQILKKEELWNNAKNGEINIRNFSVESNLKNSSTLSPINIPQKNIEDFYRMLIVQANTIEKLI